MTIGAAPSHGIERAEWVARFTARITNLLQLQPLEVEHIIGAELESWPEVPGRFDSDWRELTPEDAADSNLSYWN